jgi:hypothetical protein
LVTLLALRPDIPMAPLTVYKGHSHGGKGWQQRATNTMSSRTSTRSGIPVWQRDGGATALAGARLLPNPQRKQPQTPTRPTTHNTHPAPRQHGTRHTPENPQKKREPAYNNRGWGPPAGVGRLEPSATAIPPAPHTA